MKREAQDQILFNNYLRESDLTGFFEIKHSSTEYFNYCHFQPHQLKSLQALQKNGLVWKISDTDPRLKPCDCFSTPPLYSYVVIKYPRAFVVIGIDDFLLEKSKGLKNLYYTHACSIAHKVIHV